MERFIKSGTCTTYKGVFMKAYTIIMMVCILMLGWALYSFVAEANTMKYEISSTSELRADASIRENSIKADEKPKTSLFDDFIGNDIEERASPHDFITEKQIKVYKDRVVIMIDNPEWAAFTDTNSMDPVLDAESNAIEIVPRSTRDIHVGDIVSYKSRYADGTILHRVVEIGEDKDGWYCRMKGDNISKIDPEKIRFKQIQRVVVAIIY